MIPKLRTLWLILTSKAYYVISNRGSMMFLPENEKILEAMLVEIDNLDQTVSECLDEIHLRDY